MLRTRDCNWDYGLWDKGYEMIKIKKLETRETNLGFAIWNVKEYRIEGLGIH